MLSLDVEISKSTSHISLIVLTPIFGIYVILPNFLIISTTEKVNNVLKIT